MTQDGNRAQQVELYGASMADLVGGVAATLGLSQAKVAALIGISAPMLSQLVSAHRVKLGNPVAVARLQRALVLSREVAAGRLAASAALSQLQSEDAGQVLTRTTTTVRQPAADVQQLLRSLASAGELLAAAELLAEQHPQLAELLRIYGAGRTDEAEAHYRQHMGG